MKRNNKIIILLLAFVIKLGMLTAQVDTLFWFAAPWSTPDHTERDNIVVHLSTFSAPVTTVHLWQPAAIAPNKYDTIIHIGPNTTFNYIFWRDKIAAGPGGTTVCATPSALATYTGAINAGFDSLETKPANTVVPYGICINASSNITAVYDVVCEPPGYLNPETFSLMGQNGLGLEFVCPQQTLYRNRTLGDKLNTPCGVDQPKQQIVIVASQPNTVVWITPRCAVVGHPANITYSIMLPSAGSAYNIENLVQNTYVPGNNLSGTIVVANKPIAVTVADDSINSIYSNPSDPNVTQVNDLGCYDLIGDQIVPVDIVGKDYIVNRGLLFGTGQQNANDPGMKESAFIVATDNFTHLTITDGGVTTNTLINKGDTYVDTLLSPLAYIHADKNVYVYHASGIGCELGSAILPPLTCAGSSLVAFSRNTPQKFALNILCKNGSQGTFTLNNTPSLTPVSAFTMVAGTATLPGGPFWGATIDLFSTSVLPIGSYTIGNNTDVFALGVFDGDYTSGGLYHYMSAFLRKTIVTTQTLSPVCASPQASVMLTGTVSGAAITGEWAVGSVTAPALPGPYTSSLNVISIPYNLTATDTLHDTLYFYLRSTGACKTETALAKVKVNQRPKVVINTSGNIIMCKNNVMPIMLNGTVLNALSGSWSGGNGGVFGPPGPVSSYTPSQADHAVNTITLTLTSSGPLSGCSNSSRTIAVNFTDPPNVNAGPIPVVCSNSSTLALGGIISGITNTGVWSTSGTGLFFPNNATPTATYQLSQTDLSQAELTFTLTSTFNATNNPGGCQAESSALAIGITSKPVVSVPQNTTVCASDIQIALNGNISGSASQGVWSTSNGTGIFTQQPPTSATYTFSQNDTLVGSVEFVLTSQGGICPQESDSFEVQIKKTIYAIITTSTPILCNNAPIYLVGGFSGPVSTYSWLTTGTGSFSPSNSVLSPLYYPSATDLVNPPVITLDFVNPTGCGAKKDTFTPTFATAPIALFSTLPATPCLGSNILMANASNPNGTYDITYNWDFGTGLPTGISTYSSPVTSYTNSGFYVTTLTVTGTSSLTTNGNTYTVSCPDAVSDTIKIYPLPVVDFSVTNACQNLPTLFENLSYSPLGTARIDTLFWTFAAGSSFTISPPTPTIAYTYSTSSSNEVHLAVSTANGCRNEIRKNVGINAQPAAQFAMTNNPSVVEEPVYFSDFTQPKGHITYWYWEFGDTYASNDSTPVHHYQNAGVYSITLTVTDNQGCKDSIIKDIEITLLPQVPSGFTPNNDGHNDKLFVKGGPFAIMTFQVYNGWGELMFETRDQTIGWDGKKNGVDQPVGVYVWTLMVEMYNNREVRKNGDVSLIR